MRWANHPLAIALAVLSLSNGLTAPALAQQLGQATEDSVSPWRVLAALIFCILLGFGALAAMRRWNLQLPVWPIFSGSSAGTRRLRIIETLRVAPQVQLCLIACDEETLLLAASPQGVTVLERLGPARPMSAKGSMPEAES